MPFLPRQVRCCLLPQVAVILFVFVSNAQPVSAQGKKNVKGPAFTQPPKNDWNYELMGE